MIGIREIVAGALQCRHVVHGRKPHSGAERCMRHRGRVGVELGVRFDGGDAETGAGAEAGAGIGYVHEGIGLSVDAQGRALVAHQASSFREWGASVAVRLQPSREAGGLSLTLEPTWGNAASGMAMLWRDGLAGGAAGAFLGASSAWTSPGGAPLAGGRANSSAGGLRMEMDYAIILADESRVAPFGRWTAESGLARRLNVGIRLSGHEPLWAKT